MFERYFSNSTPPYIRLVENLIPPPCYSSGTLTVMPQHFPQATSTGVEELQACNSQQNRGGEVTADEAAQMGAPVDSAQDEAQCEVKSDNYIDIACTLVKALSQCDEGAE